ncbi:DUF1579 domain-containing protein, partial [bacterium]|nr:DUF1579 domain-containing protein [bacterium]
LLIFGIATASDDMQMSPEDMAKMQQMMMEMGTPGEGHKVLDRMVGSWEITQKMHGMGETPMESKGSAEIQWILGGRWIQQNLSADMMGKPFNGMGLIGYDNFKNAYVTAWVDDMSTSLWYATGWYNKKYDLIEQYGQMDEYMTNESDRTARHVIRFKDEDKFIYEIHDPHIGGENTLVLEITYSRKK